VAVKIILPRYANHPDFIRRFESEAQFVARLEHAADLVGVAFIEQQNRMNVAVSRVKHVDDADAMAAAGRYVTKGTNANPHPPFLL